METFIARQPNGLICRFSTRTDTITHYNMTEEDYNMTEEDYTTDVHMKIYGSDRERAEAEARDTIEHYMLPFSEVVSHFFPYNNTSEEFLKMLREMGDTETKLEDLNAIEDD